MPVTFAIIILAAGSSRRLGRPKQLLSYNGTSLLSHVIDQANLSGADPVIVVLGAGANELLKEIDDKKIHSIVNPYWEQGIASSIRAGVTTLQVIAPAIQAVTIAVCDQPFLSATLLQQLQAKFLETKSPIVASSYGTTIGTPVLFDRSCFTDLLRLHGDKGARQLILSRPGDVVTVEFPKGSIDIDTPEDYASLG